MKRSLVYTIAAILAAIFGLGFLLIPHQVMSLYGNTLDVLSAFLCRYFGSALFGVAVILWYMRNATSIKTAERACTMGVLILVVTGLIVSIWDTIAGTHGWFIWINVVVYGLLTILFAILAFKKE